MGKAKYSQELKLEIVLKHVNEHIGIAELSATYHISKGDIQKWRDAYLVYGADGLKVIKNYTKHDGGFKVAVVEYMYSTGMSIRKAAAHFNIASYTSLSQWEQIYREKGKEALYMDERGKSMNRRRGRPRKKEASTDKALLKEVRDLRMENEYLKKLFALIQEREKSGRKIR